MKKNIILNILAAFILAAAMTIAFASCEKIDPLNPEAEDLPEASFTLSAIETRGTEVEFPWTISKDGKTDSVNEEIDDMYVTQYNELVIIVSNEKSGFRGVNVASSNTNAVVVEELTPKSYRLKYKHDGEADVTVWNGNKRKSSTTVTFHVNAVKEIKPEAVLFLFDEGTKREQIISTKLWVTTESDLQKLSEEYTYAPQRRLLTTEDYSFVWDFKEKETEDLHPELGVTIHTIRYLAVEPENISFRNIKFTTKAWDESEKRYIGVKTWLIDENEEREIIVQGWYNWLNEHDYQYDWSQYEGDLENLHKNTYFAKKNVICGMNSPFGMCEIRFMNLGTIKYGTALMSVSYHWDTLDLN